MCIRDRPARVQARVEASPTSPKRFVRSRKAPWQRPRTTYRHAWKRRYQPFRSAPDKLGAGGKPSTFLTAEGL
eukprot:7705368-Pyramimonas_sp.AAC.1